MEVDHAPAASTGWTRHRVGFALGGVAAGIVTAVFATIGDGVDSSADGVLGVLLAYGHTAVWALLTSALAAAALHGQWNRISSALAVAALVMYLAFLAALPQAP